MTELYEDILDPLVNSELLLCRLLEDRDNGIPAKLIRDVALRALCPNSLFSKVVSVNSCLKITHLFW
jgi:hypothetical protein